MSRHFHVSCGSAWGFVALAWPEGFQQKGDAVLSLPFGLTGLKLESKRPAAHSITCCCLDPALLASLRACFRL